MAQPDYSPGEELANRLTHGLGAALSVAGLVLMVFFSARHGDGWQIVSTAIYGSTLVLLYTTSTLYHSFQGERRRVLLRKFDHAAIFLLIAGTYTPFVLVTLRGPWGWSLFGVVWGLAIAGVTLKFWFAGRFRLVSTLIYLGMGWLVLFALRPLMAALPAGSTYWWPADCATPAGRSSTSGAGCPITTPSGICSSWGAVPATGRRFSATWCRGAGRHPRKI